jgi:asparagine synthase (glutamine-hydrolysing)
LKIIAKELLAEYLPRDLFEREKRGFAIPLKHWLKTDLKYILEDFINRDLLYDLGLTEYKNIQKLKNKFYEGQDFLYNKLWALAMLGLWYDNYKNKTK